MATLILTAVGSAIGGPIGGAIGSIIGQQVDQAVFAPKGREGPRLKELEVQTSSYGTAIPAIFGAMRVAGTVIWATDLVERRRKSSGGKGRPSTTEYSYSANIAVAISSRPISRIGRIWADGNLLRGAGGDLKVETILRVYTGHDDQHLDPLLASAEAAGQCPAHRGLAYAVFEDLQLADFGNRIPSLTFEVFERETPVPVSAIFDAATAEIVEASSAELLGGYALTGEDARTAVSPLLDAFPIMLRAKASRLELRDYWVSAAAAQLVDLDLVTNDGLTKHDRPTKLLNPSQTVPRRLAIRHYEPARDYQSGLQSSDREGAGRAVKHIDLPAALTATDAKRVAELQMLDAHRARDTWALTVPTGVEPLYAGDWITDASGKSWRITELQHFRGSTKISARGSLGSDPSGFAVASPGRNVGAPDLLPGQTQLSVIDLPVFDTVDPGKIIVGIFANGNSAGWRSAALSVQQGDQLVEIGGTAAPAAIGHTLTALLPHSPHLLDTVNLLDIEMLHDNINIEGLTGSAAFCKVGEEFICFRSSVPIGNGRYRLSGLQRGCYGTEAAIGGHQVGEQCVVLETTSVRVLEGVAISQGATLTVEALGIGDVLPATATTTIIGRSIAPLSPVHCRANLNVDGSVAITWVRRSRIDFGWNDGVDQPIVEDVEQYNVLLTVDDITVNSWTTLQNSLSLDTQTVADLVSIVGPNLHFTVRQVGRHMQSAPISIEINATT